MSTLDCSHISVEFGERRVLEDVSLGLSSGEIVGLIGPNGAGKTTLLRVIASLIRPLTGVVRLDDEPVDTLPGRELARRIAYLPQGQEVDWPLSVERLVSLGRIPWLDPWSRMGEADRDAVTAALNMADVEALAQRTVNRLSGGERARVLLARVLAGEPDFLLVDEPTASLDPGHQLGVMNLLRRKADEGAGVVAVLHDLTLAARYCDRLLLLHDGRPVIEDVPANVVSTENLAQVYGISAHVGETEDGHFVVPGHPVDGS